MNITINLIDTYCTSCSKNSIERNEIITSRSTSLELQNSYILNVLSSSNGITTIIIQNGRKVIIRNIQNNVETSILIPSRCTHIITLTITNNE